MAIDQETDASSREVGAYVLAAFRVAIVRFKLVIGFGGSDLLIGDTFWITCHKLQLMDVTFKIKRMNIYV